MTRCGAIGARIRILGIGISVVSVWIRPVYACVFIVVRHICMKFYE
jgi:hypothetical protein